MRRITIIGGGQAGLQLGIGLRQKAYDVRIVTNRTASDIRVGQVMSSQCMFDDALQIERDLGIDFWNHECPNIDGIGLKLPADDGSGLVLDWAHRFDKPAKSVDQRIKFPGWMNYFQDIGGRLALHEVQISDLEQYSKDSDLVIVASGKADITGLFERDAARSPFEKPARALGMVYVTGIPHDEPFPIVTFNVIPGVGEFFVIPALTTSGTCDILIFQGLPNGPMDCWDDVHSPADYLARSKEIIRKFVPWQAERCETMVLTDTNGVLAGRLTPTVRKPVGRLPSGTLVLGMADFVVLNDPITGQGSNNAAKCAHIYLGSILERGRDPFDLAWMQLTFERYWDYAKWSTDFTNAFLKPPPPHVIGVLGAAQISGRVGRAFVNGFNDPRTLFPWLADPAEADRFIGEETSEISPC